MSHPDLAVRGFRVDHRTVRIGLAVVAAEAFLLVAYFAVTTAEVTAVRYLVYPFVWINAGLWAVARTAPNPSNRRHLLVGLVVGGAYFLAVMALPGNVGLGDVGAPVSARIGWYAPGWGPLLAVTGPVRLYLVPFEVVGYASLAYLVYANVLGVARSAVPGVLGLVTCVGCTVPVLVPLVGLLGGPAASLATTAYAWSYDLGTLVYLLTVGLLFVAHRRGRPCAASTPTRVPR